MEAAHLSKRETITLYDHIARSTVDRNGAERAASKILGMDLDVGQRAMAYLATNAGADPEFQLRAAGRAGGYGKPVLRTLADRAPSTEVQWEATQLLYKVDEKGGAAAVWKLVKKRGAGEIRIKAAQLLPRPERLTALLYITGDRGNDDIRYAAGMRAKDIDPPRGRRALTDLANDRTVSTRIREAIRHHLDR